MLSIGVLGALEVQVDGVVAALGGPVPRRLMAALTLGDGASMTDDEIVELVWGREPPVDPKGALRVSVSRLRGGLGRFRTELDRTATGYRLSVGPELRIDRALFVDAVAAGRERLDAGDADGAEAALLGALDRWRGTPWEDLGDQPELMGPRAKLIEIRDVAFEELQAARLARGDAPSAVAALSQAVIESPYRERRWELLALGLYRTGRQSQALAELRRLKDLLDTELGVEPGPALQRLEQRILQHDGTLVMPASANPPPPAVTVRPANIPTSGLLSAFVGRDQESATLVDLMATRRLVTLIGPAGVGKTRLAYEFVAERSRGDTTSDTWVVRLADIGSSQEVGHVVAAHVVAAQAVGDPLAQLQRMLVDRRALLVLDNCEHVLDGVREVVAPLLHAAPGLQVLTTSRQSIEIDGEYLLEVPPLAVTNSDGGDGDAVTLLFDRVRATRPRWEPTVDELRAARALCTQLDGLPLAIELAASRVRSVGLVELAQHLGDRLDLLGRIATGLVTPHATLQTAIGWSVDQLTDVDRALLLRLWPFEGGFTWQAAEFVDPHDDEATGPVLTVLASLVDRSVLVADTDTDGGSTRYRLLETIRRYCRDRDPDPGTTRDAHAGWLRQLVSDNALLLGGPRIREAFAVLRAELPNIRAAIAHDLQRHPTEALRTVAALDWAWISLGVLSEGVVLLRAALHAAVDAGAEDRAAALIALSNNLYQAGDAKGAAAAADEAVAGLTSSPGAGYGQRALLARAYLQRVAAAAELGHTAAAVAALDGYERAVRGATVPEWLQSCALLARGATEVLRGDVTRGAEMLQRARDAGRDCGFVWTQGTCEVLLARIWLAQPDCTREDARRAAQSIINAVNVFEAQLHIGSQLSAMFFGTECLVHLGAADDAHRLKTVIVDHAERMGFDARRYRSSIASGTNGTPDTATTRTMSVTDISTEFRKVVDRL